MPVDSVVQRRRIRLDMTQDDLGKEAGVNRDTVGAVESGGGSPRSRRKINDALDRLEADARLAPMGETGSTPPEIVEQSTPERPPMIRFIVEGVYGAKALIVEAPPENRAELEAAVDRIMRALQQGAAGDQS